MEIKDPKTIDEKSLEIIREHMRLVIEKEAQHKSQVGTTNPFSTYINGQTLTIC